MSFASPLSFQGLCWKTIPSPAQLYKVTEGCSLSSPIQRRKRTNYTLFFISLHRTNPSHYNSKHYFKKQYTSFCVHIYIYTHTHASKSSIHLACSPAAGNSHSTTPLKGALISTNRSLTAQSLQTLKFPLNFGP